MNDKIENCLNIEDQWRLKNFEVENQKMLACETHEHNLNLITVTLLVGIIGFIGIIVSQTINNAPLFALIGFFFGIIGCMIILYKGRSWVHNVCIEKHGHTINSICYGKYFYDRSIPLQQAAEPQKAAESPDNDKNVIKHYEFVRDPFDYLNEEFDFPNKLEQLDWSEKFKGYDINFKYNVYTSLRGKSVHPDNFGLRHVDEDVKKIIIALGVMGIAGCLLISTLFIEDLNQYIECFDIITLFVFNALFVILLIIAIIVIAITTFLCYWGINKLIDNMKYTKNDVQDAIDNAQRIRKRKEFEIDRVK